MEISPQFVAFAAFTAEITFYVLMSLNIASIAIIAERATFFWRRRIDPDLLLRQMLHFLHQNDLVRAKAVLARSPAAESRMLLAGVAEIERGTEAAVDAMRAARIRERIRMDTNLTMLKAVAFSAPALGVLGTLLGILSVMPHLALPLLSPQGLAGSAIRESLGALAITAAGLLVGIPAALASLLFDRRVQFSEERSLALMHPALGAFKQYRAARNPAPAAGDAAMPEKPAAAATPNPGAGAPVNTPAPPSEAPSVAASTAAPPAAPAADKAAPKAAVSTSSAPPIAAPPAVAAPVAARGPALDPSSAAAATRSASIAVSGAGNLTSSTLFVSVPPLRSEPTDARIKKDSRPDKAA